MFSSARQSVLMSADPTALQRPYMSTSTEVLNSIDGCYKIIGLIDPKGLTTELKSNANIQLDSADLYSDADFA